ncbi:MAG: glutamate--tRNA ligase [Acutalibacteraceae bacterium]
MDFEKLAELLFPNVDKSTEYYEQLYPARDLPEGAVVTRMAPSPTGFVHLGNLVMGLTAERMAHQSGGILYLRIEDTDAKREVEGAAEALIHALREYNIQFDEGATADGDNGAYGPYKQRQRREIYHAFAKKLVLEGKAYPCFCTEDELRVMHEKQEAEKANFGYYGKWAIWRDRSFEEIEAKIKAGEPYVLRFRSEGSVEHKIKFTDLIKGQLELTENDIDHVLLKSDGIPTYHFAHAVDDHLMRTTHVVRDDSWLSTLPFHLQLFAALGFKPPKYLHIGPLMKMDGTSKRKLSKRKDPELAVAYYRQEGFPAESVYEYLMTVLNSNFEDWRRADRTADADKFKFSYKKMNPAGSLFDRDKLCDVSKNVISCFTADYVLECVLRWAEEFDPAFYSALDAHRDTAEAFFAIGRGGKKPRKDFARWSEVPDHIGYMFDVTYQPCFELPENISKQDASEILQKYIEIYDENDDGNAWFDKVKSICAPLGFSPDVRAYKENPDGFKGHVGDVSNVLRLAVTGKTTTPDLCTIMKLLGKERCIARMRAHI